ncbi:MAG: phage tail tape measure protein [Spirochaetes bacterium]|nr:MAG: phage tail tape measure protein [Spirochaetota bacterium]
MNDGDFTLRAVLGIKDDASGPAGRIQGHFANLKSEIGKTETGLKSFNKHMDDLKSGAKLLAIGAAAGLVTKSLASARVEVAQLESDIKSVDVSDTGIANIHTSADEIGRAFGITKEAFMAGVYDLKSGVSSLTDDTLPKFYSISVKTAMATKGIPEQMGNHFAATYNVFKSQLKNITDLQIAEKIGNVTTYVANKYRADGAKIEQSFKTIGAAFKSVGGEMEEQGVLLGTIMNMDDAGKAGTMFEAFLRDVGKAGGKLGLEFTDSLGHIKPVVEIIESIKRKFPDLKSLSAQASLKDAFGSDEAVKFVTFLEDKTGSIRDDLTELKSIKLGSSLFEQGAQIRADNLSADINKLDAGWKSLKETLGQSIESPLRFVITGIKEAIYWIAGFLNEYPALKDFVGLGIAGAAVFFTIAGAIKVATGAMGLYKLMTAAAAAATGTQAAVTSGGLLPALWASVKAMWAYTAALLANPTTWVIIGIVALVAGIVQLVKHWDKVKTAVVGTWDGIKTTIDDALTWVKDKFLAAWEWIKSTWENAPGWVKGLVALVMLPLWPFVAMARVIINNWESIKGFFISVFDTVRTASIGAWEKMKLGAAAAWQWTKNAWNGIASYFDGLGDFMFAPLLYAFNAIKTVVTFVQEHLGAFFDWLWDKIKMIWEPVKEVLTAVGDWFFGDSTRQAESAGKKFGETWGRGVKSSSGLIQSLMGDMLKSAVEPNFNKSDAKTGPLANTSRWGRSFVSTWAGGVEHEADRNQAVRKFVGLVAEPIKTTSPVIQSLTENSSRAVNINPRQLINLTLQGGAKNMSIEEFSRMLAEVLFKELNSLEATVG